MPCWYEGVRHLLISTKENELIDVVRIDYLIQQTWQYSEKDIDCSNANGHVRPHCEGHPQGQMDKGRCSWWRRESQREVVNQIDTSIKSARKARCSSKIYRTRHGERYWQRRWILWPFCESTFWTFSNLKPIHSIEIVTWTELVPQIVPRNASRLIYALVESRRPRLYASPNRVFTCTTA